MSSLSLMAQPFFSSPARWALRVLSWLAFGMSAYLAWSAIDGSSMAGCIVGSASGCDAVQSSAWSMWLGIPVAVLGLACYASLAALSVLLGMQSAASRWITTAFIFLATLAAGASAWFIALQVAVIGELCWDCITTDLCGLAIGGIVAWSALRWGNSRVGATGHPSATLAALRGATQGRLAPIAATRPAAQTTAAAPRAATQPPTPRPAASARTVPLVGSVASSPARRFNLPPSLLLAYGGAIAVLVFFIGGQIILPSKTFEVQQVALKDSITLSGSDNTDSADSGSSETRVAMRIPTDADESGSDPASTDSASPESTAGSTSGEDGTKATSEKSNSAPADPISSASKPEREINLLGGKLTLNVYDHPIIGSPEAEHIVVELISYDCSHCRKSNRIIKQALSRYGDQVALLVIPIPLEMRCNKLIKDPSASHSGACTTAGTALAISKIKPAYFARFHDFVMSGNKDKAPPVTRVLTKAYTMVDRTKLKESREGQEIPKQIASYVDLFAKLQQLNRNKKEFGLPIQILGDHIMSGTVEKADDLYKAWEEHLDLKAR